jgi:peptide chain release factor 1
MDFKVLSKLEDLLKRYKFLEEKLVEPEVLNNSSLFLDFHKEHSSLKNLINLFIDYKNINSNLNDLKLLLNSDDSELKSLVLEEFDLLTLRIKKIENAILALLSVEKKIESYNNIFLEIRAATGGDESSIFAEDLFNMYSAYFLHNKWKMEVMSFSYGNIGGYKEIIIRVVGNKVYDFMKK